MKAEGFVRVNVRQPILDGITRLHIHGRRSGFSFIVQYSADKKYVALHFTNWFCPVVVLN